MNILTKQPKVQFSWKMACARAIKDMQKDIKIFENTGKGDLVMDKKRDLLTYQKKYKEKFESG